VSEVDKEKGRIGLKLLAKLDGDTEITPEQLVEVAERTPAPPREERPPRRDRDRGGPRRR
jgi:hypothetical protein